TIIIINSNIAQIKPLKKPLPASLNATLKLLCSSISPVEILRTDTASDCVPELPDIPLIIGINAANNDTCAKVSSNDPSIVAVIIPKNVKIISHGKRFLAVLMTESLVASTSDTPSKRESSSLASSSITSKISSIVIIPNK